MINVNEFNTKNSNGFGLSQTYKPKHAEPSDSSQIDVLSLPAAPFNEQLQYNVLIPIFSPIHPQESLFITPLHLHLPLLPRGIVPLALNPLPARVNLNLKLREDDRPREEIDGRHQTS